jgi:hypothetical protein
MKQEELEEELKFKNRQIGAAGFVANKIMENMINKPKLDTVGKEFYETADMTITVKKQETLEEAAENYLLSSVERNQYGDELSFIDGAKWQVERMYEIMNAYVDDVMGGCNLRAKEWFEQNKNK